MLRWYYSVDTVTVLEITDRVNWPDIGVGSYAEEGSGWSGELQVNDPDGDLMRLCWRRIYAVEDAASGNQVVGNWFISDIDVIRDNPKVLASRRWLVTMADENSLLERRILVGADAKRPAETSVARIRWLLTTTELNTLDPDETFIDTTAPVNMDAVDYTGQKCSDVIQDCQQQQAEGWNYFVMYREDLTPHVYSLAYFNFNTSTLYPSTLSLTNIASEVDIASGVYPIAAETRLARSGMRLASGEYLPYSGGYVYVQNATTGTTYVYRDVSAPAVNVKTSAKATTRANQHLAQMVEPEDEITTAIVVEEADLNLAMHGMRIQLHATHLPNYTDDTAQPGYADGTVMRIKRREVTQLGPTTFRVGLILTPARVAGAAACYLFRPQVTGLLAGQSNYVGWGADGDEPPFGDGAPSGPSVGLLAPLANTLGLTGVSGPLLDMGVLVSGTGTITVEGSHRVFTACDGVNWQIDYHVGSTMNPAVDPIVATGTVVTAGGFGGEISIGPSSPVSVSPGDIVYAYSQHLGSDGCTVYEDGTGTFPPAGNAFNWFVVTGTLA